VWPCGGDGRLDARAALAALAPEAVDPAIARTQPA